MASPCCCQKEKGYKLYLVGSQIGNSIAVPASGNTNGTLRLGKDTFDAALDGGGSQFYGLLYDVAIFDSALTGNQIKDPSKSLHLSGTDANLLAGFVFGHQPVGGLPAKLARPQTLSVGATICAVSENREYAADSKKMPLASTRFMRLPYPTETREIKQSYQGQNAWNSHNGYAAFCLDFIVAERGVSEADRIKKTRGKSCYKYD